MDESRGLPSPRGLGLMSGRNTLSHQGSRASATNPLVLD
jgi:hypothetical protein